MPVGPAVDGLLVTGCWLLVAGYWLMIPSALFSGKFLVKIFQLFDFSISAS